MCDHQVAACLDVYPEKNKDCGEYSSSVIGKTLNGVPGIISDLLVDCKQNPRTAINTVHIHWKPPTNPNGIIDKYKIDLKETTTYINEEGQKQYYKQEHVHNVAGSMRNFTYYNALPNTNYTVKVSEAFFVFLDYSVC